MILVNNSLIYTGNILKPINIFNISPVYINHLIKFSQKMFSGTSVPSEISFQPFHPAAKSTQRRRLACKSRIIHRTSHFCPGMTSDIQPCSSRGEPKLTPEYASMKRYTQLKYAGTREVKQY